MATACSSSRFRSPISRRANAAGCAVAAAIAALSAFVPADAVAATLVATLVPGRTSLCVGEKATIVLDLDLEGAELYTERPDPFDAFFGRSSPRSDALSLSGIPEARDIVGFGQFERANAPRAGVMRFVSEVEAIAPGDISFSPVISGTVARTVATRGFVRQISTEPFSAAAGSISLRVSEVPKEGRPADFCGAVGDALQLAATLEPAECALGDLVTLRWTITGPGAGLAAPVVWTPGDGFKSYPPREGEHDENSFSATQIVIPVDESASNAAPFSVSWFDPAAGSFRTQSAGPWSLRFRERPEPEEVQAVTTGDEVASNSPALPRSHGAPNASSDGAPDDAIETAASDSTKAPPKVGASVGAEFQTTESLPARFAPWPKSRALYQIPAGTSVKVREISENGWLRVLLPSGATGWIKAPDTSQN